MIKVTLVDCFEGPDIYRFTVADTDLRYHTVEIPRNLLGVSPVHFSRGSDSQHIATIAAGAVLLSLDPETTFHKVDRSMVDRAYTAASGAKIVGSFGN